MASDRVCGGRTPSWTGIHVPLAVVVAFHRPGARRHSEALRVLVGVLDKVEAPVPERSPADRKQENPERKFG